MADNELRKLRRSELLELLVQLSQENESLKQDNQALRARLYDKAIRLQSAGSIAEAALQLNEVFSAAQRAADQYLANVRQQQADNPNLLLEETLRRCSQLEAEARQKLAEAEQQGAAMVAAAKEKADAQWATLRQRLEQYCAEHEGLKEQLGLRV